MTDTRAPVQILLDHAKATPHELWLSQPVAGRTHTYTWAQAAEMVGRMAAALKAQGWPAGSAVAISGFNTAHWFLADFAIQMAGFVPVGLYPKQAASATRYICEHCEAKAVFLGPMMDGPEFVASLPPGMLKIRLPYPTAPHGDTDWDAFASGHAPLRSYVAPDPDATLTLIYTSGTTGHPKGAMITPRNLAFAATSLLALLPPGRNERLFSYLPLAHLLERGVVEMASLYWHAEVHFLEKLELMAEQLPKVAPTRFAAVPLVWTRFHSGITAKIPEGRLRLLMKIPILGRLLRRRLLTRLGLQNLRSCFSGAAPLPKATIEFFRDILGIEILEAYGMTENCAYVSCGLPGTTRVGSVGKPHPNAGFRLSDEGEIQVKHPGVMKGYHKDPERTRETFTEDGWLKTGDKGRVDGDGYLYITGRVKDIFKTLKGKYVAPAPIEGAMARNTDIDQLCLVGMNLTQPVMMITLTPGARAKAKADLEAGLLSSLDDVNRGLEEHEKIAKLLVTNDTWSIDNGFMTPTLKVRRNVVEERYGAFIDREAKVRETRLAWQ
ncbi:MAG TPA: AMP-binding protein [Nevskiaceae bacterium]|nr:AMP-binding protein [Nevskiaceae bacterium]